jgi:hypothetical protein
MDNYEYTKLMLITDSLSFLPIINRDEVSVAIENMMKDGLNVLFLNVAFQNHTSKNIMAICSSRG